MQKFLPSILFFSCLFLMLPIAQSQTFWEEDFSDGFPNGWSTEDLSNNDFLWTWCATPSPVGPGCPPVFDDVAENQAPFASTTASNGFMTCNSDAAGNPLPENHISVLTTNAIDCSNESEVFLQFQTHFGIFAKNAAEQAFVRVSTDLNSWTSFLPFTDLYGLFTDRWSDNPETITFDITEVAAGNSTVYIQWLWIANYDFIWSIDDIVLLNEDPTPIFDLQVKENFFIIPPYIKTPISQVTPLRFLADVENIGQANQTNVKLSINIKKLFPDQIVHTEELDYGGMQSGQLIENVVFFEEFTPTETGFYEGTYEVSSDSVDLVPENNIQTFRFEITDSTFAKTLGGNPIGLRPGDGSWIINEPHAWGYGVHYQVPEGEDVFASSVSFGIANPEALSGESVVAWLYEWTDLNENGDCEAAERTNRGFANYVILGTELPVGTITVPLQNIGTGPIFLDNGKEYILMLQFEPSTPTADLEIQTEVFLDYKAQFTISDSLDLFPKYHTYAYIGNPGTFTHNGFNLPSGKMILTPDIRLNIGGDIFSSSFDLPGYSFDLKYFPNPATDVLHVNVEFENQEKLIDIQIYDLLGRLVKSQVFNDTKLLNHTIDLNTLDIGTYILEVKTKQGSLREKFIVERF